MRAATLLTALLLLLPAIANCATPDRFRWAPLTGNKDFEPLRPNLQRLVDADGTERTNRLCVVAQQPIDGYEVAYVHWPARNKLILWEPSTDDPDAIAHSRRYLDLKTDVVEGNDVHGSSYLVTRAWANSVIDACRRHGRTVTIIKEPGNGR